MHIVKTFMDIKRLENNNALPVAIINMLRQDLVQVIDNMQQLGYFYDPDNDGYVAYSVQKIVHRQEKPEYQHIIHLTLPEVIKAKIFIIAGTSDDGEIPIATMMLAEEY